MNGEQGSDAGDDVSAAGTAMDRRKILVVDDDPFVLKLLTRQLMQLGFQDILAFERAGDALALLEGSPDAIDLILSDLQMPGMDGIEFVRNLVNARYAGGLLLVSGEDRRVLQSARRLAALQGLRVIGTLQKPASASQLREQLHGGACEPQLVAIRHGGLGVGADALRTAIAGGEVAVAFTPKVTLADGAVAGMEVSPCWLRPHIGALRAGELFSAAQAHGLLGELGDATLRAALVQARKWLDAGREWAISIHLPMAAMNALPLPERFERMAHQAGVPLSKLVLAISGLQRHAEPVSTLDVLTRLRLKGVTLSIHDFGVGDASLAQLRDIPFEELKLGRGLVHGAWNDNASRTMLEATIAMARQLGVRSVAAGVDDACDWRYLRDIGCGAAQGRFVGEPMPAADVVPWTHAWTQRYRSLA